MGGLSSTAAVCLCTQHAALHGKASFRTSLSHYVCCGSLAAQMWVSTLLHPDLVMMCVSNTVRPFLPPLLVGLNTHLLLRQLSEPLSALVAYKQCTYVAHTHWSLWFQTASCSSLLYAAAVVVLT